jgi:cysteinyl-tRNA synthetase
LLAVLLVSLLAVPGDSRAQSIAPKTNTASQPIDPFAAGEVIDFRQQMRAFIQSLSDYARSISPNFMVIARNGLALVSKPDPTDDTVLYPASDYLHALNGIMETGLLDETVTTPDGKPDPDLEAAVKRRKENLTIAQNAGVSVFDLEFSTDPKAIDGLYTALSKKGLVPFVAEAPELGTIPTHPHAPFSANAQTITTTAVARNFLYVANPKSFGNTARFLQALNGTNFDVIVLDVFQNGKPLTRDDVMGLKYKKLGSPRLVLAQMDISTAGRSSYFWKPGWGEGNPPFLYKPVRETPDRMHAIYWNGGWQALFTGDFNSYVYGLIDLGFDGVVLKGVDAWRYFEVGGDQE